MPTSEQASPSNWYQHLEANRQFIIGAVVFVCFVLVAATSLQNPTDYDGYWHLKMGKDWIESGLSPYKDHYSFTFNGHDISSPPVLFQAGLYSLVKCFGEWGGFVSIKILASFLTIGFMLVWLKQVKASTLAYCIIFPILAILLQLRAQVRPELFSYSLSIIALILYQRANLRLTFNAIAPIALLLLVWNNYHASILGYVIFFGLFIDIGFRLILEKENKKYWLMWAGWGIALVAIGFLKPGMGHPLYEAITFDNEWKSLISEYKPATIHKHLISAYILATIATATLITAIHKKKFGYFLCSGVLLYAGLSMGRMITPAGIIILGMFAHLLSDIQIQQALQAQNNKFFRFGGLAVLVVLITPIYECVTVARNTLISNQSLKSLFPENLVNYMIENNKSGRIFNDYAMGGYLIYKLSPDSQVYIDGRTNILYPIEHLKKWRQVSLNIEDLKKETQLYNFDFAVLDSNARRARQIYQAGQLSLDFVDGMYALYSREPSDLMTTGKLWAEPYCWTKAESQTLEEEWQTAQSKLPTTAPVMQILWIATQYVTKEDQKSWLKELASIKLINDDGKRFVGYRALEHGLNEIALKLFSSISVRERKDHLAATLALLRNNKPDEAEEALNKAIKLPQYQFEFIDKIIIQGLLTEIEKQRPLKFIEEGLPAYMSEELGEAALNYKNSLVRVQTFCDGT